MQQEKDRAPAATATVLVTEALAAFDTPAGLAEISTATGLNKNMISRILSSLTDAGWVVADSSRYSLTLRPFRVASTALGKKTLSRCAAPHLSHLNEVSGECVQLAVLSGGQAVYIAQYEAQTIAGVRGKLGAGYPLDTTAPGKVLKAFSSSDPKDEKIRAQGFATDDEEYGRGVVCIAAPVFDHTGNAVGAVCIASLVVNGSVDELCRRHLSVLLDETRALSRELGYLPGEETQK